jgi:hypothetical protein
MVIKNVSGNFMIFKKRIYGSIFLLSFVFFLIYLFPYREIADYYTYKFFREKGLNVNYSSVRVVFNKAFYRDFIILKDDDQILRFDELKIALKPAGIIVNGILSNTELTARINKNMIFYVLNNLKLSGSAEEILGDGLVTINGNYDIKRLKAEGLFTLNCNKLMNYPVKDNFLVKGKYSFEKMKINALFEIKSRAVNANGNITFFIHQNLSDSVIEGILDTGSLKMRLSGSLSDPVVSD